MTRSPSRFRCPPGRDHALPTRDCTVEVHQFYTRQMRLLDVHDLDAHAQTITADATFERIPGSRPVSARAAGRQALRQWDRGSKDPIQRRHWPSMLGLARGAVVLSKTRSCAVRDVSIRGAGHLLTRSRKARRDQL